MSVNRNSVNMRGSSDKKSMGDKARASVCEDFVLKTRSDLGAMQVRASPSYMLMYIQSNSFPQLGKVRPTISPFAFSLKQELPKRPGAPSSVQLYRSMIVRNGVPVLVRLLLKYASSPTTTMDFNREIQLHKKLSGEVMFIHKRHGSFETEHSTYLVLDDALGYAALHLIRFTYVYNLRIRLDQLCPNFVQFPLHIDTQVPLV